MKRACIVGWPVSHSLSPVIHGYWLKECGLHGEYIKQPVEPADFEAFLTGLARLGFVGANVTVPHKIEAFRLCQHLDGAAQAIGAVNTVWLEDGELHGSNTDAHGFMASLDAASPGWDRPGPATVIGAGGAARAIVWSLLPRGFTGIRIVNRSESRAAELAASFPPARAYGLAGLPKALEGASLVVNSDAHRPDDILTPAWAEHVARCAGIPEELLEAILLENPRRLMTRARASAEPGGWA